MTKKTKYKMTIEEAVDRAIDECIAEGVMVDILLKFRAEVKKMSIFEYNEQLHEETLKKEGFEHGRFIVLCELEEDGLLTLEQVAGRMGMTPVEFLKKKRKEQVLV